jgi:hypothetical protein
MKVRDLDTSWLRWCSLMWYGYAFEAIYIVLGTALFATVLCILIYHH